MPAGSTLVVTYGNHYIMHYNMERMFPTYTSMTSGDADVTAMWQHSYSITSDISINHGQWVEIIRGLNQPLITDATGFFMRHSNDSSWSFDGNLSGGIGARSLPRNWSCARSRHDDGLCYWDLYSASPNAIIYPMQNLTYVSSDERTLSPFTVPWPTVAWEPQWTNYSYEDSGDHGILHHVSDYAARFAGWRNWYARGDKSSSTEASYVDASAGWTEEIAFHFVLPQT